MDCPLIECIDPKSFQSQNENMIYRDIVMFGPLNRTETSKRKYGIYSEVIGKSHNVILEKDGEQVINISVENETITRKGKTVTFDDVFSIFDRLDKIEEAIFEIDSRPPESGGRLYQEGKDSFESRTRN